MIYTYRSRLNQLPLDMKYEVGEITFQKGMQAPMRKSKVVEILKKYNIDFTEVGTGTNRFIVKYDGFAVKIALDGDGIADNKQEYAVCNGLGRSVSRAFELSRGGHLLVAEYCPAFTSYQELFDRHITLERILGEWSQSYLLGDVGISRNNFANWGLRGNEPVCIDYAYIFPASLHVFKCICGESNIAPTDQTFTAYKCLECGRVIEDASLRQRITPAARLRMLANATEGSIAMQAPTLDVEIPDDVIVKPLGPDDPEYL